MGEQVGRPAMRPASLYGAGQAQFVYFQEGTPDPQWPKKKAPSPPAPDFLPLEEWERETEIQPAVD
jgi:hypothetical protein